MVSTELAIYAIEELLLAGGLDGVLHLPEAIMGATAGECNKSILHRHVPLTPVCMGGEHGCRNQERHQGTCVSTDPDRAFFIFT